VGGEHEAPEKGQRMNPAFSFMSATTIRERLRRLTGPRPVLLIGFAGLVLVILASCLFVVLDSQAKSRLEAEKRFSAEATISAELTASIFNSSAGAAQQAATKAFGARTVDERAVDSFARRSRSGYAFILDRDGKLLAASSGAPAAVRTRASDTHIREALAGRSTISDVLPARDGSSVVEWAMPFETRFGRRVEVQALKAQLIFQFLSGYLGRTAEAGRGYVLDRQNHVLGASGKAAKVGDRPAVPKLLAALATRTSGRYHEGEGDRYFASAPVTGSTWRVVLNEPTAQLYPALVGSRRWLLFAMLGAFGVAGAFGLVFLRRALMSGAKLTEANRELTEVNATLEERVAERTAAAEERARELARSNAELEQFASVTSHDLQEPLRKIRMFGDRLQAKLGEGLPEEPAKDLGRMQNAAARMQLLITDLLNFSRVTSKGAEFERVDLGQVADEVLGDLEARVLELNARVDVGDLPTVEADRTQMRQLIQNLVSNALKFHREDEPPVIQIRGDLVAGQAPRFAGEAAAADRCVITVEDNGIGFDEKYADRVFVAFQRLHTRSSYDGTGIGLSIARKIVWRHGGDISATSKPGEGSTFTVTLPVDRRNGHNGSSDGGVQ
jgi:signal transduction histidine kinase